MHATGWSLSWVGTFLAIFVIGMFVRLVIQNRLGLVAFLVALLAVGGGLISFRSQPAMVRPRIVHDEHVALGTVVKVQETTPSLLVTAETPPAPPLASAVSPDPDATIADHGPPLTLFRGSSTQGVPIDSLPGWVAGLSDAPAGSDLVSFSSDRFATIEEAEKQLWRQAREFVGGDLRLRIPQATHWTPASDFLKSQGFIVERCVERTALQVGSFVEPMYRVHWKASLSQDLRTAVVDAWRPAVQESRLEAVTLGFLGATAGFAFLNVILRSVAARLAARKAPAV